MDNACLWWKKLNFIFFDVPIFGYCWRQEQQQQWQAKKQRMEHGLILAQGLHVVVVVVVVVVVENLLSKKLTTFTFKQAEPCCMCVGWTLPEIQNAHHPTQVEPPAGGSSSPTSSACFLGLLLPAEVPYFRQLGTTKGEGRGWGKRYIWMFLSGSLDQWILLWASHIIQAGNFHLT